MPDWQPYIRPRLASLGLSPSREAEIAEELAQHLDDRWRDLVARGVAPDEAAHTARTEFDGARLEALLGTLRQARWKETPPPGPARAFSFDSLLIDLRHAIRALRATPSFTLGALLVLRSARAPRPRSSLSPTRSRSGRFHFPTPTALSRWGSAWT
jgi:hypothetical protein